MVDLSHLSDEDVMKAAGLSAGGGGGAAQPSSLAHLSDDDVLKAAGLPAQAPDPRGALGKVEDAAFSGLGAVGKVGRFVDQYTGAPVRAAVGSLQNDASNISGAFKAYGKQFGNNPDLAPTGKQIMAKAGVSTEPILSDQQLPQALQNPGPWKTLGLLKNMATASPAGLLGIPTDLATDPTAILPVGAVAKEATAGARGLIHGAQDLGEAAKIPLKSVATNVTSKVGEALTGVPKQEIKTYIQRLDDVNNLIAKHGEDVAGAADAIRETYGSNIQTVRRTMNDQISSALKKAAPDQTIDIAPILQKLEDAKARINPKLKPEAIGEINDISRRIGDVSGPEGKVSAGELFQVQDFLRDQSAGAYQKNGQIFMPKNSDITLQAAKSASAVTRKILNATSPEIAQANNKLSLLHSVEQDMNKNLIAAGKPENALIQAGASVGNRNRKNLERLENITGTPMIQQAEDLSAMKAFSSPKIYNPQASKSFIATGTGYLIGHAPGAFIAGAMTSPAALKAAINTGAVSGEAIQKLLGYPAKLTDATLAQAHQILSTPFGQDTFRRILQGSRLSSSQGLIAPPAQGLLTAPGGP